MESRKYSHEIIKTSDIMTDANIISNYLQGIFWANLGVNMFNTIVSEKKLDTAKDAAERVL